MERFPTPEWLAALCNKLNGDGRYSHVARNWEGDIVFDISSDGRLPSPITMYLDPTGSIIMLAGIYYGAQYGGTAITFGLWGGLLASAVMMGWGESMVNTAIDRDLAHIQVHKPGFIQERDINLYIPRGMEVLKKIR